MLVAIPAPRPAAAPVAPGGPIHSRPPRALRRKCACGGSVAAPGGECEACRGERAGVQSKLQLGPPDDAYEREADRAAEAVMRDAPAPSMQPSPGSMQRPPSEAAPDRVARVVASPGHPLEPASRATMEARFGHRFDHVRIHADGEAAVSAGEIGARAYTLGAHIAFATGEYRPATPAGQRLLAHELAHVAQLGPARAQSSARVVRRAPAPAVPGGAPGLPGGVPNVPNIPSSAARAAAAPPGPVPAPASAVCPACACATGHVTRIDAARRKAEKVLGAAATQLQSPTRAVDRLFEGAFGAGSATAANVAKAADLYSGAAAFLGQSKLSDPPGSGNVHCDPTNSTDMCQAGNTAYYTQGNVVVCSQNPSPAQMLNPPTVPTQYQVEGKAGSAYDEVRQVPDPGATALAQQRSDAAFETRLTAVMAHEAIHHVVQPGVVDVYTNERLFRFLGGQGKKHGVDLSPLALQNPDSLVLFAFRGYTLDAGSDALPEAEAAMATSEQLSGKLSVRPVLGRPRAELAVALAEEAIGQANEALAVLLTEVKSVQGGPSAWTSFPAPSQQLVQALVGPGKETAFGQPDAAALARLQTLSTAFERLSTAVHDKKLVVGRRFLVDKPATRIEIAVPDWRAFRKMAPGDQLSVVLRTLLNEEPDIAHLDSFVLDLARQRGGMANL